MSIGRNFDLEFFSTKCYYYQWYSDAWYANAIVWHRLVTIDQYISRFASYNHNTGQSMYNIQRSLGIDLKEFMLKVHNPLRLSHF